MMSSAANGTLGRGLFRRKQSEYRSAKHHQQPTTKRRLFPGIMNANSETRVFAESDGGGGSDPVAQFHQLISICHLEEIWRSESRLLCSLLRSDGRASVKLAPPTEDDDDED